MIVAEKELKIEGGYAPDLQMKMGEVNRQYILIPPFDISTYSVRSEIVKPDNTFVYTDQAINTDGNILLTLPEQAGAVAGYGHYIIKIYDLNTIVYSAVGVLRIDDHLILDGMIESVAEVNGYEFPDDFVIRGELGNIFDDSTVSNETGWTSQKISQEIGSAAVVFDDTQISNSLGWTSSKINNELLGMFDNTITSNTKGWSSSKIDSEIAGVLDDNTTSSTTGWSSSKIDTEISGVLDDNTTSSTTGWSSDKITTEINAHTPTVSKTATGNPIELTDAADAPMVSCVTEIVGSQNLHGYDKPWVGGAGKNKLPLVLADIKTLNTSGTWSGNNYTVNSVTFSVITDNGGNITGVEVHGTASATALLYFKKTPDLLNNTYYILNGCPSNGSTNTYALSYSNNSNVAYSDIGLGVDIQKFDYTTYPNSSVYIVIYSGYTANNLLFKPMIRLATETNPTFTPYSNICPITAYTTGTIEVSDEDSNTTTYTTTFPSAIYRGSEDVAEGGVSYDMPVIDLGNLTWIRTATTDGSKYRFYADLSATIKKPSSNDYVANLVCTNYVAISATYTYGLFDGIAVNTNGMLLIYDSTKDTMSASDFQSTMSGVMLAYELATPTTSTVTVSNSPIRTLSGYNHIESTTGDMEVEYITKTYEPIIKALEHN